ncbi:MAG: hypothetical protein Tsb0021_10080 [Chlamydiales bacterium]
MVLIINNTDQNISSKINSLEFNDKDNLVSNLTKFRNILNSCEAKVSFWGGRYITSPDSVESVSVDFIAKKILQIERHYSSDFELSLEARVLGLDLTKRVRTIYTETDKKIQSSNIFTRVFNFIREFSFFPYTTRFYIKESSSFQRFPIHKYYEIFNPSIRIESSDIMEFVIVPGKELRKKLEASNTSNI